ncbi:MAG TPA: helix-turn-helix transcriptional regulator [Steroidobacteraceae bacterium]|jgi:DNA-binding CsgD family transcriptional regulator
MTAPRVTIPAVVESLYAGTLDEGAWHQAWLNVADLFRASGALLFAFNPLSGAVLRDENHRIDPAIVSDYAAHWTFEDSRRVAFTNTPVGIAVTERTLGLPELRNSAFFNEFLLPVDAPHFMPAWLRKTPAKAVAVSLLGSVRRGAFGPDDVRTLQVHLLPHMARALEIRDRLQTAQIRSQALAHSLEGCAFGLLVLDSAGRTLETNAIAEQYLREGDGLRRLGTGIVKLPEPAEGQLRAWLASGIPPTDTRGHLTIKRPTKLPLSAVLSQLPPTRTSWLSPDPRWLMLIFDPERRITASAASLEQTLGVTARESEVAARLFEGFGPIEIARQLGVSRETVRSQLKSIFRKTGTRSQAELVRSIALGPALHHDRAGPRGS